MSTRVLVVTEDTLAPRMAGPAIRAWHIADALAGRCDVVLATTSPSELQSERFTVETVDDTRAGELEQWCDVLVLQGYVLHRLPVLRRSAKVLVCDLYDPLHLEVLELTRTEGEPERSINVANTVATLAEQLRRGDFFLCASAKQRDLWLGFLTAMGRVNASNYDRDPTLASLVAEVPFGLPDQPPQRTRPAVRGVVPGIDADDEVVLWGGGVYDWLDPVTLVRAAGLLSERRPRLRVFFLGGRHPNPAVFPAKALLDARRLAEDLGVLGRHVFFNEDWVEYDDRQNFLLEADVGVSLHLEHLETAYSFRARVVDYLWAGLPVVTTAGDGFAELVAREELGAVVPAGDAAAVADAVDGLLADPERRRACGRRVEQVGERFRWSTVLAPLVSFCTAPRHAADSPTWAMPGDAGAARPDGDLGAVAPSGQAIGVVAALRADLRTAARLWRHGGAPAVIGVARHRSRELVSRARARARRH